MHLAGILRRLRRLVSPSAYELRAFPLPHAKTSRKGRSWCTRRGYFGGCAASCRLRRTNQGLFPCRMQRPPARGGLGAPGGDTSAAAPPRVAFGVRTMGSHPCRIQRPPARGGLGAPGGDRTHNLQRRRLTRYPIAPRVHKSGESPVCKLIIAHSAGKCFAFCGGYGIISEKILTFGEVWRRKRLWLA